MVERIMRIIRLDKTVFKEIASDPNATQQAAIVVVIAAVLSGIGRALQGNSFLGLIMGILMGVIGWVVWAFVTQFVGKALFQGKASLDQLLRVLGYSQAPTFLGIFVFIFCIGGLISLVGSILSFIAGIIALMQVEDFDVGKAIVTIIVGFIAVGIVSAILGLIFGIHYLVLSR
jgi:hypothetical protein